MLKLILNVGMIKVKRIYEPLDKNDGFRILVDGLWPRGISKEKVDLWLKEIAPSKELRIWFSHKKERFDEFKKRYFEELRDKKKLLKKIKELEKEKGIVTLLYAARDKEFNNAQVLKEFLEGNL